MVVLWIILFDGFTIKYKQESEIDLKKSMEVTLQTLESQGAQNMIKNKRILKLKKESAV
jgi:hypothetical protein